MDLQAQSAALAEQAGRFATPIAAAKRYAALSARFDPALALKTLDGIDGETAAVVASALAAAADTNPDAGATWLLRPAERRFILGALAESNGLGPAIAERRAHPADPETADLLAALAGEAPFSLAAVTGALTAKPPRDYLIRLVAALDRAGAPAPAFGLLEEVRGQLTEIDRQRRRDRIAARGFFGRAPEKAELLGWFDHPLAAAPARTAFLQGLPGIGKSALVEEMAGVLKDRYDAMTVRLDFDRAGLDVLDLLGLTMEVARQIADRLGSAGQALRDARLAAASTSRGQERLGATRRQSFPTELAAAIGAAVTASGRPVLLAMDTMEVLRARGERHPAMLFEWIDGLIGAGLAPLRIVAAGRGAVFDRMADRVGCAIALEGLDGAATTQLLDRLEVPAAARAAVARVAGGNPLVLRLAADVVAQYGVAKLPKRLDKEVAAAFLYRFLLSRIDDPVLRRLAHPGLIARRISAGFLRAVLAPKLRLPPIDAAQADVLFAALASQHWLIAPDPDDPEFVCHRGDMRAVLLPLLYRDRPGMCARIDAAAAAWFGARDDDASQLDAAYHRLQLMRTRPARPMIGMGVALRFDPGMLAELPGQARALVQGITGGRSAILRGPAGTASSDDGAVTTELLNLIDRQDWAEGEYVVDQIEAAGGLDARSPAADAIRAFRWRAGQWADARRLLAERDRLAADDDDLAALPPVVALARLEMRAEFTPRLLDAALRTPAAGAVIEAGWTEGSTAAQGALAFVLAARGRRAERSGRDGDAVAAALELWTDDDGRGPAAAFTFGVARERLAARGLSSPNRIDWNDPQLLAALSPYPLFAANLSTQAGHGEIAAAAGRADEALAEAGALFHRPAEGIAPLPSNPIAGIAGIGLFAEWAEARAFLTRDQDLATIGRAAERWRRTTAGDWRYGRPPPGWRAADPIDRTLATRIAVLAEAHDPHEAALAQLALWAADGDGAALRATLGRRLAAALRHAGGEADPGQCAQRLLSRNVPAAFVPPLAILLTPTGTTGGSYAH